MRMQVLAIRHGVPASGVLQCSRIRSRRWSRFQRGEPDFLRSGGAFIATVPTLTHRIRRIEGLLQTLSPRQRFRVPHVSTRVAKFAERAE